VLVAVFVLVPGAVANVAVGGVSGKLGFVGSTGAVIMAYRRPIEQ
jgi:hypothetical protein